MFGTLPAPCGSCLRAFESRYRALYCGLGCSLARTYGYPFRLLLSNDIAFLSLMLNGFKYEQIGVEISRCCNPIASPRPVAVETRETSFCAALSIFLFDHWLLDRRIDSNSGLGFGYGLGRRVLEPKVKQACETLEDSGVDTVSLSAVLKSQPEIELRVRRGRASVLECAYPAEFLCVEVLRPFWGFHAVAVGEPLGRLIYFMDALIDCAGDTRRGHFNPIQFSWATEIHKIVSSTYSQLRHALRGLDFKAEAEALLHIVEQRIPSKLAGLGLPIFQTKRDDKTEPEQDEGGRSESEEEKQTGSCSSDSAVCCMDCCCDCCVNTNGNLCHSSEPVTTAFDGCGCCDFSDCCCACDCSP